MNSLEENSDGWLHGNGGHWLPENTIEIEQKNLSIVTEKICRECRHPYLTLRVFVHLLCGIGDDGCAYVSARQLAKRLDVHYDTLTKSLKYLREIGAVGIRR